LPNFYKTSNTGASVGVFACSNSIDGAGIFVNNNLVFQGGNSMISVNNLADHSHTNKSNSALSNYVYNTTNNVGYAQPNNFSGSVPCYKNPSIVQNPLSSAMINRTVNQTEYYPRFVCVQYIIKVRSTTVNHQQQNDNSNTTIGQNGDVFVGSIDLTSLNNQIARMQQTIANHTQLIDDIMNSDYAQIDVQANQMQINSIIANVTALWQKLFRQAPPSMGQIYI
jgi:hypothetical protein